MTFEELYQNYKLDTDEGKKAHALIEQTHWYSSVVQPWTDSAQTDDQPGFDPRTGEVPSLPLNVVLQRISQPCASKVRKDRLWRITEHVRPSLIKLFRELNEAPCRENATMPLRAVRELDTASFMALSRRPGRNIREKLAEKPYLMAVRHFQTVDLSENRLLKAFAERLCELLELRVKCLGEKPDDLILLIRSWLNSDEAKSIGRWDNLPPNNTLLSHRHYRAIYDAWGWMKSIDEDVSNDMAKLVERQEMMDNWLQCGDMYASGKCVFAEMPVLFKYDTFEMHYWTDKTDKLAVIMRQKTESRHLQEDVDSIATCIDLTELFPRFAVLKQEQSGLGQANHLPWPFIWQRWQREGNKDGKTDKVDITLFQAEAAYLHSDATTISAPDLFFSTDHSAEHLNLAARSFATKLRTTFGNTFLFWLLPDYLNDFELEITRRNLNACFPDATPLPRSVAAVFENVDYDVLHNGYAVVVLDSVGGKICATKLEARYDNELNEKVPETHGFYWERHPTIMLSEAEPEATEAQNDGTRLDIIHVDANGKWQRPKHFETPRFYSQSQLQENQRIGSFDVLVRIADSPVVGGIRLFALQKKAGKLALWQDQIPELSIKVWNNGRYKYTKIVTRGTTVRPIRGHAKRIDVNETFTLPAGKTHYSLPLCIGENDDEIGFSASLESPAFPLKKNVECELNLTFTYGVDDAYSLIFEPLDKSIPSIRVKWKREGEEIVTDAPSPDYPKRLSWYELQHYPKKDSSETTDLLEWASEFINFKFCDERKSGEIINDWKTDRNGQQYTLVRCNQEQAIVRINALDFVDESDYSVFHKGEKVSFVLNVKENKCERKTGIITKWVPDGKGFIYVTISCEDGKIDTRINANSFVDGIDYSTFGIGSNISFVLNIKESDKPRRTGTIVSDWITDYNGSNYILIQCNGIGFNLRVYENRFASDVDSSVFRNGDEVSFELVEHDGKIRCYKVASLDYKEKLNFVSRIAQSGYQDKLYSATRVAGLNYDKLFSQEEIINAIIRIHKIIYFPIIQVWRDGRSVSDVDCPLSFRKKTNDIINHFLKNTSNGNMPKEITDEIMCLMAFMHKDAPEECIHWLEGLIDQGTLYKKQAIGFALGDVSTSWQRQLFTKLINNQDNDSLRVFAYAIWREPHFVEQFTAKECQSILARLKAMLQKVTTFKPREDDNQRSKRFSWIRSVAEPLELLLGLLRTRASQDTEIKMLLQPNQKTTRELAKEVDRITDLIVEANVKHFSRVQLGNLPQKNESDQTPDLLYALRLYLTGDDGANAIQVTGVNDSDDE